MPPKHSRLVSLAAARQSVHSGDLLLFRGAGLISAAIGIAGRSRYSHAARVVDWAGELFCCEVREWHGGRAVTLASQVARYPGRIDVFETNPGEMFPGYDREAANAYMRSLCGCCYGWPSILATAAYHTPFVRLFASRDFREADAPSHPYCSQACSLADKAGGVDPVPNLPAYLTEPGDLARSHFYAYRFTLETV